jgi:hypothetical protein
MRRKLPGIYAGRRGDCVNCGDSDVAEIAAASARRVTVAPGGEMLSESILGEKVPHEDPDSRSFYLWDLDEVPCH